MAAESASPRLLVADVVERIRPGALQLPPWSWYVSTLLFACGDCLGLACGIDDLSREAVLSYYNAYPRDLQDTLASSLRASCPMPPLLAMHRVAFYINRAQHSIASALDRLINGLLSSGCDENHRQAWTEQLFPSWVGSKVLTLQLHRCSDTKVRDTAKSLAEAFREYSNPRLVSEVIHRLQPLARGKTLLEVWAIDMQIPFPEAYITICNERTNAWKHLPLGTWERHSNAETLPPLGSYDDPEQPLSALRIEWCCTLRALESLGMFAARTLELEAEGGFACPVCNPKNK